MHNLKTDYLSIFEHICTIPHGSGNTRKIAEFCRDFAIFHGCCAIIDNIGNVIIKCSASDGFENHPTVILQGHTDMVCEKSQNSDHDFEKDPLKLIYEDGYLRADGTTLGGDDGIAVAFALSIIADKTLKHPPLEILLTTDEETGLYGAEALDGTMLDGRIMINIDSEEEGVLLSGCAGGLTAAYSCLFEPMLVKGTTVKLFLSGLAGGHSGADIHKNRLNGVKLLSKACHRLLEFGCLLVSFNCGNKMNAIPFNGEAIIYVPENNVHVIKDVVEDCLNEIKACAVSQDDNPQINLTFFNNQETSTLNADDSKQLIEFLCSIPDGIVSYTSADRTLVETSLNIGVANYENGDFKGVSLLRSSVNDDLDELSLSVTRTCKKHNMNVNFFDRYPAWEFRNNSVLRDKMCEIYKDMFNAELKVDVIHAGLECGILSDKIPGLDCVSIGPNIQDIHTCQEKLDLASCERTYNFILKVLESL